MHPERGATTRLGVSMRVSRGFREGSQRFPGGFPGVSMGVSRGFLGFPRVSEPRADKRSSAKQLYFPHRSHRAGGFQSLANAPIIILKHQNALAAVLAGAPGNGEAAF